MNERLGITIESSKSIDELSSALEKVSPERGFRVLAMHNVTETLAGKGFEIEPLRIYEVCNAGFAHKAIKSDVSVAMFMPCKIVLRAGENKTTLTLVRPSMISEMLPEAGLTDLAIDVEKQLLEIMNEVK